MLAVNREERDRHAECLNALRTEKCSRCVVSKCSMCVVSDGWRKFYQKVKLEWSMCLAPESCQDSYDTLMIDYQKMFTGEPVAYSSLNRRSYALLGWIRHVNESTIECNRMNVEKRGWYRNLIVNGHVQVFGGVNGTRSLKHLESKVVQIPGVIRTRIDTTIGAKRPCLTIFVSLDMAPASYRQMISVVKAHIEAENVGVSLVERQFADRYDFVDIGDSPVVSSPRFDVDRYDSLDLSKSTVFQRFRRRRKHRKRKPPDINTVWGRLKIVFRGRKVIKYWLKTGEAP